MAGPEEDELNESRIAPGNGSDGKGEKANNGRERKDDGTVTVGHRPGATDETVARMSAQGYERHDHFTEGEPREEANAATGHVVTVLTRSQVLAARRGDPLARRTPCGGYRNM